MSRRHRLLRSAIAAAAAAAAGLLIRSMVKAVSAPEDGTGRAPPGRPTEEPPQMRPDQTLSRIGGGLWGRFPTRW
jgi:hypothetical protein